MRPSVALTVMVATLLLFSPFLPKIATAQPSQGNWVVTGTQEVQNESIMLNGNLTIESGGNLTLRRVELSFAVSTNGQYGIFVQPGGSLYIYNSGVGSADGIHRYAFQANGTSFVLENSTVADAGWCDISGDQGVCMGSNPAAFNGDEGLQVITDGALIEGNSISGSGVGITLAGANDVVLGNRITASNYSSLVVTYRLMGGGPYLTNDTIEQNSFQQDVLLDSSVIYLDGTGGNLIQNNTFTHTQTVGQVTLFAVWDAGGWTNTIRDNSISTTAGIWIMSGTANDIIVDNRITFCEAGIEFINVPANLAENNTLFSGPPGLSNGHSCGGAGLTIRGGRNITFSGNSVSAADVAVSKGKGGSFDPDVAISLVQSIDGRIANNNLTSWGFGTPIYSIDSSGNTIAGNLLSSTRNFTLNFLESGIFLFSSSNNTIYDNQSNSTDLYSISLMGSNSNTIYGNNFLGGQEAYDNGRNNSWTFKGTGNYWGTSSGGSPYTIPPDGLDSSPLASPLKVGPVSLPPYNPAPFPVSFTGTYTSISVSNTSVIDSVSQTYEAGGIQVNGGGNLTIENSRIAVGTESGFSIDVESEGHLLIVNSSIDLGTGSFKIRPGGSLAIIGSTITVTGTAHVALDIEVSGSLKIQDSRISSAPDSGGFDIESAADYASLIVTHSILSGGSDSSDVDQTIKWNNDYLVMSINDSLLENFSGGIVSEGAHSAFQLSNDTFLNIPNPTAIETQSRAIFVNNIIENALLGLGNSAGHLVLTGNTVNDTWSAGLSFQCSGDVYLACTVTGNKVDNSLGQGIAISANDALIANNTVSNSNGGIAVFGDNNVVYGNTVVNSDSGIWVNGANDTAYNNNFTPSPTITTTSKTVTGATSISESSSATSNASTTSPESSMSSKSGGIPEFPFQLLAVATVASLSVASYLLFRRKGFH